MQIAAFRFLALSFILTLSEIPGSLNFNPLDFNPLILF